MAAAAMVFGAVLCLALYFVVEREDTTRESTADDAMWERSIEDFRRAAKKRAKPAIADPAIVQRPGSETALPATKPRARPGARDGAGILIGL
jgi:hypothetical protein